jgi:RNA polymerase sigma-70 factor, ECF subfamily
VGLRLIEDLFARDLLTDYAVAHSARGELCRRLGRTNDAVESLRRALSLTTQEPQRRFLEQRVRELLASERAVR